MNEIKHKIDKLIDVNTLFIELCDLTINCFCCPFHKRTYKHKKQHCYLKEMISVNNFVIKAYNRK